MPTVPRSPETSSKSGWPRASTCSAPMESIYRWDGNIENEIGAPARHQDVSRSGGRVVGPGARTASLRHAGVPGDLPIVDGNDAYLRWVAESTTWIVSVELKWRASGERATNAYASACARSSMRSAGSSIPAEIRTRPSVKSDLRASLRRHRRVRHRCRMRDQRLDTAEALGKGHQPDALAHVVTPPPDCRRRTSASRQIPSSDVSRVRAAGATASPGYSTAFTFGCPARIFGQRLAVCVVLRHPQRQRLRSPQDQPRIERAEDRSGGILNELQMTRCRRRCTATTIPPTLSL